MIESYEKDYLEKQRQRIAEIYGLCDDNSIRKFIADGCVEGFRQEYFRKHNIKSLSDKVKN